MPDINILVVDDEKEIADLIEIYLVSDGYKVFKAENADQKADFASYMTGISYGVTVEKDGNVVPQQ